MTSVNLDSAQVVVICGVLCDRSLLDFLCLSFGINGEMTMGIVRFGPPTELILQLRDRYALRDFIETGTYYGGTAAWASSHFDNVITIEYSQGVYQEAVARYGDIQNIDFIFGDSRSVLREIVPKLTKSVFWLDSHWCGGKSYGEDDQCPLIEEIDEINKSAIAHFIFIDDARLFTSPPPLPNRIEHWPALDEVIQALQSGKNRYYIVIFEDVIIAVPQYAKETVASWCQEVNTKAWKERGRRRNESKVKQGYRLTEQGLSLMGLGLYATLKRMASKPVEVMMSKLFVLYLVRQ